MGDLWKLGPHRLYCGDSRHTATYNALMQGDLLKVVLADAPYNVKIAGHVSQSERLAHREFAMGVGELSDVEFIVFLQTVMALSSSFCAPGAVHFWFMDWRHQLELVTATRAVGLEHLNTCVWVKDNGGMGGLYRSQHEFIGVFKVPGAPHRNNVALGKHGRNRTNVWKYPGATTLSKSSDEGRLNELHPTVKPVALIADALLDCSARGDLVLDPFLGSGSTLIAAERVGRICRGAELDPLYVDAAIDRWQRLTGDKAVHRETGIRFDDLRHRAEAVNG